MKVIQKGAVRDIDPVDIKQAIRNGQLKVEHRLYNYKDPFKFDHFGVLEVYLSDTTSGDTIQLAKITIPREI